MTTQSTSSDLSFSLLSLLSRERGVYGLRNGDYERYRHHCANKIHRLRQVSNATCGKGKVYKKPPPLTPESIKDVKQLQLLLFSAERALAHSHEYRSQSTKPNHPSSTRKDQLSWLRRALLYSTQLYSISQSISSSSSSINKQTLSEITIYHLSIRSELKFERAEYAESLTDLSTRRHLLTTLSSSAKGSYDQALAVEFIDAYDPLIRFCAYKLGRPDSHDIEGVVGDVDEEMMEESVQGFKGLVEGLRGELGAEEVEKGRRELEDVEFGGEKVELRSAEIVSVMLRVQEALGKLKGKEGVKGKGGGMKGWDRVLGVLGEAEGVAKKLLDDHQASGSASSLKSTKTTESLTLAHQYIVHLLLTNRIRRDLLLADSLQASNTALPADSTSFRIPGGKTKVEEAVKGLAGVIKLYDAVLQSMGQLRGLAIVEEKEGVRAGAEGAEAYFHATRCYHLARLHCIHPTPSYSSAVQLLTRASRLVEQSQHTLIDLSIPILEPITPITSTTISELSTRISALDNAAKRALFAERVEKPVFFDTAFNYIDMPLDELLVLAGKKERGEAKKKGEEGGAGIVEEVKGVVEEVVKKGVTGVVGRERTREATPGGEEVGPGGKARDEKPKGWLGGWFGRG